MEATMPVFSSFMGMTSYSQSISNFAMKISNWEKELNENLHVETNPLVCICPSSDLEKLL
jgi:hypothetical protein